MRLTDERRLALITAGSEPIYGHDLLGGWPATKGKQTATPHVIDALVDAGLLRLDESSGGYRITDEGQTALKRSLRSHRASCEEA